MVGTVVKDNVGELEEEVREGFSRRTRKELTGAFQGVSGKKRFLVIFKNGCKKYLASNQLTFVIVDKIPVEEEPDVTTIPEIPEEQVPSEMICYHGVYVNVSFNKEGVFDRKEEQVNV